MLGNKAKPRRLNSKGNLNNIYFRKPSLDTKFSKVGRALFNSIPVLSIFALVGMISYTIGINVLEDITNTGSESAYAVTIPDGTPSASLTISGNGTTEQISAGRGSTAYRTHTVNVKAGDISDYSITISGPSNMTSPSGGSAITGTDGNKTGSNLTANTWGYAWGDSTSENDAMTYKALSTSGTSLTSSDKPTISNNAVEFTRKLVFAVKFDEDTAEGRYYAENVNLALTVNPKLIVVGVWTNPDNTTKDSGISTMQAMTYDICSDSSVKTGATMLLQDSRDDNIYSIGKLSDGKCWMKENLRIVGKTVSSTDSDMTSGSFTIPNAKNGFAGTDNNAAYYDGDTNYGAYYSWFTATAGTGTSSLTSGDASASICPKGWKLPKGGADGDFMSLYNKYHPADIATLEAYEGKNGFWLGASSEQAGGSFFTAAGYYNDSNHLSAGSRGLYWARTALSGNNVASVFYFYADNLRPSSDDYRNRGNSVRCIVEEPKTIKTITTMQEMTPQICKASAIGDANTLIDNRTGSYTYTIAKLSDNNCWMTQNLRLAGSTSMTNSDTDLNNITSYRLPATSSSSFSSSNNAAQQMRNSSANDYGAYYSWCAVTANTCQINGTAIINSDAASSICPRGWKLPSKNDYYALNAKYSGTWTTSGSRTGRWLGGASIATGGAFFPTAGVFDTNGLYTNGNDGYYWTRSADSSADDAYALYFFKDSILPAYTFKRYRGFSVRCVAYPS